jgi:methionyl aminopeptidase
MIITNMHIKNKQEISKMCVVGKMAASVLEMIESYVKPGVTTDFLNTICHDYIVNIQRAIPAPLNYMGFPKSICTSVNHVVCHGIPNNTILKNGDIINIDITNIFDKYHGDTSKMFFVGSDISNQAKNLCKVTYQCMWNAINLVKPGNYMGDLGYIMEQYARKHNYHVVKEFCGHGIGTVFHEEEIQVLNYGKRKEGLKLIPGMTFTIEPMLNIGTGNIQILSDGWTVVTKDNSLSAQYEHTVLVTKTGVKVLTLRNEEF